MVIMVLCIIVVKGLLRFEVLVEGLLKVKTFYMHRLVDW
jgi:hypothetical protein